jgi:hypothetical protein
MMLQGGSQQRCRKKKLAEFLVPFSEAIVHQDIGSKLFFPPRVAICSSVSIQTRTLQPVKPARNPESGRGGLQQKLN